METYAPALRYSDFHVLQAKVYRVVEQKLSIRARLFEQFWQDPKLKEPVKQALRAVMMDNEEGLSQKAIARKLGIPFETHRARVRAGIGRLEAHFPEWIPRRLQPEPVKSSFWQTDLIFNGFLRKSLAMRAGEMNHWSSATQEWARIPPRVIPYLKLKLTPQAGFEAKRRAYQASGLGSAAGREKGRAIRARSLPQGSAPQEGRALNLSHGRGEIKYRPEGLTLDSWLEIQGIEMPQ